MVDCTYSTYSISTYMVQSGIVIQSLPTVPTCYCCTINIYPEYVIGKNSASSINKDSIIQLGRSSWNSKSSNQLTWEEIDKLLFWMVISFIYTVHTVHWHWHLLHKKNDYPEHNIMFHKSIKGPSWIVIKYEAICTMYSQNINVFLFVPIVQTMPNILNFKIYLSLMYRLDIRNSDLGSE